MDTIPNICDSALLPPGSPWTCPRNHVFYDSLVVWGLIEPPSIFRDLGYYSAWVWLLCLAATVAAPRSSWFWIDVPIPLPIAMVVTCTRVVVSLSSTWQMLAPWNFGLGVLKLEKRDRRTISWAAVMLPIFPESTHSNHSLGVPVSPIFQTLSLAGSRSIRWRWGGETGRAFYAKIMYGKLLCLCRDLQFS